MSAIIVHHVLKDGTQVDDIAGHVIKAEQHEALYQIIERITEERNKKCQKAD